MLVDISTAPHGKNHPIGKTLVWTGVSCIFLLIIWWLTMGWYQDQLLKTQKERVQQELMPYGYSLASVVNSRFALLEGLAAFVYAHPTESDLQSNFEMFARGLATGKNNIRALQIFPSDVPEHVYPALRNQAIIGGSLKKLINDDRPNVRADVKRTIETRKMARSIPYRLRQGGMGLVARKAIFHGDTFWGLVAVVLDIPPVIRESGLLRLSESMKLMLSDRTGSAFWSSGNGKLNEPVYLSINLIDGEWFLAAEPATGWGAAIQAPLATFRRLSLVIVVLCTFLIYFIISRQNRLMIQVRKRTASLAASQIRYQKLITQMVTGFALHEIINDEAGVPRDYRYLEINKAFRQAMELDVDVIGKTALEVCPEIKPFWIEIYGNIANSQKPAQFETYFPKMDKYFQIFAYAPQRGQFATILHDITENKKTGIMLRQQQKLESIGTLAGGVAHEINNPINGIMNYAQLILDADDTAKSVPEFASEIVHETQRVATIVRHLLTFARDEKEPQCPASMNDIVIKTLSLIRTVMKKDQISLQVDVPDHLPPIMCRSQQIQQVIMNLLTNARDAVNEKYPDFNQNKIINLRSSLVYKEGRRWIRTTVEDYGPGIPPELQDRLFDPFFTTKPKYKGTGLGLSISYGIVKDHYGNLTLQSESGNSTKFYLDLPVDLEKEADDIGLAKPGDFTIQGSVTIERGETQC